MRVNCRREELELVAFMMVHSLVSDAMKKKGVDLVSDAMKKKGVDIIIIVKTNRFASNF